MFKKYYNPKTWLILAFLAFLIIPFSGQTSLVDDLNRQIAEQEQKRAELEKKAREYQTVINQKKGEINSLQNEIAIFNAQIGKLETEIIMTEDDIYKTELEILSLTYGLEKSEKEIVDNKQTLGVIIRTINQYDETSDFQIVLGSESLSDFFNQIAYMELLQNNVQKSVEDLKNLKEQLIKNRNSQEIKKEVLEELKDRLKSKQNSLDNEKQARSALISKTKGEESSYQKMLADIESQKQSLLGDINRLREKMSAELARLEAQQQKPDPQYWAATSWFYKQDDPRWGNSNIGLSKTTMADYGCAVTSVAMVFSYHGETVTPGQLAREKIFQYNLIVWPQRWGGVQLNTLTYRTAADWFKIDRELGAGNPVIVRIQAVGKSGGHYVVIHAKTAGGRYVVHDPLFGDNIYLDSSQAYLSKLYGTTTTINQMIIYH